MFKPSILLAAVMGLTLLTACGSSYGERCAAAVQCHGGNDRDVDACVAETDGAEQVAAAYDCSDAFFKLADCVDNTATCRDKHFEASCNSESDALRSCEKAASGQ
jgi:hypothetical protein